MGPWGNLASLPAWGAGDLSVDQLLKRAISAGNSNLGGPILLS